MDFYLNVVKVTGAVTAKTGDEFEVKVRDGDIGTPVVTIDNVAVCNPCDLTFGGAVSVTGVGPEEKDDSMTITDYLLIVLVVLVVILAVIVALSLIRS